MGCVSRSMLFGNVKKIVSREYSINIIDLSIFRFCLNDRFFSFTQTLKLFSHVIIVYFTLSKQKKTENLMEKKREISLWIEMAGHLVRKVSRCH